MLVEVLFFTIAWSKKALKQGILESIKFKFYAELIDRFLKCFSSNQSGYQMSEGNENFALQGNEVYPLTRIMSLQIKFLLIADYNLFY